MTNHPLTTSLIRVFVYGTLKPGEAYYPHYCAPWVIKAEPAIAYGILFALPLGYPAMALGASPVQGFVLSFADVAILERLDELENYQASRIAGENDYQRQEVPVFYRDGEPTVPAWAYLMDLEKINRLGGQFLPDGCWSP